MLVRTLQRNQTNRMDINFLREELVGLQRPACSKSAGQAGHSGRILGLVLRQNSFFSRQPWFLLLRLSNDYMRSTHIIKGNCLYLKSAGYRCQ